VVLDLGLPDLDGLDVCRQLRGDGFPGGILILTARGGELDRVVGLDVGADDYLGKPFALAELLARTRALLRRSQRAVPEPGEQPDAPAASGLRVDRQARRVWCEEQEVGLTSKEFDLLALLDSERGAVLTRERLMDEVWDENWFGSTKTLDVTMGRLRQKLQDHQAPVQIVTVRGVGFRLEAG
jgi:DNA-binding response OmpR family regulator